MSRAAVVVVVVVLGALAMPPGAVAGGWATVGLSSLPAGSAPGSPWVVDIEVLQHGRTPLDGVQPAILLRGPGDRSARVVARPTGRAGIYRAEVVFPVAGRWSYEVDDGFGGRHAFAPVRVRTGGAAARGSGAAPARDDRPWLAPIGAALAGMLAAGLSAALMRRRPHAPSGA